MQSDIVLSSRVRLARNYADLPFDLASEPEQAETCILRTLSALRQAGLEEQYDLLRLRDMSDVSRRAMEESHLVSRCPTASTVVISSCSVRPSVTGLLIW